MLDFLSMSESIITHVRPSICPPLRGKRAGNGKSPYNMVMAYGKLLPSLLCLIIGAVLVEASARAAQLVPRTILPPAARPTPAQPHGLRIAPHLILVGNGRTLWMVVPSTVKGKPPQPGFALLMRQPSSAGVKPRWIRISSGLFLGTPLCSAGSSHLGKAAAAGTVEVKSKPGHVWLIFRGGTVQKYGLYAQSLRPALPTRIFPVAALRHDGHLFVLGYGEMPATKLPSPLIPAESKPALLPSRPVAPPSGKPGYLQAGTAPKRLAVNSEKAPAGKNADTARAVGKLPTPFVKKPLLRKPLKPPAPLIRGWYLLESHGGGWRANLIGNVGPPPHKSRMFAWPSLMQTAQSVWIFMRNSAGLKIIHAASLNNAIPRKSALKKDTTQIEIALSPHPLRIIPVSADGNSALLWATSATGASMLIHGGTLTHTNGHWRMQPWPSRPVRMAVGALGGAGELAAAGCNDRIYVVSRDNVGKLRQMEISFSGKSLVPAQIITPVSGAVGAPESYEKIVIMGLFILMILSLWHRKEPFDARALSNHFVVARLYVRFGAALVDMSVAALAVMFIFHLYSNDSWNLLFNQVRAVMFSPEQLLLDPQLLTLLGIYELHVTLGEIFFSRSIGKFLFSLRVVSQDGGKPGIVAILLRNVFRIPEMMVVVLLIYVFVSVQRQRLGDLLAHTVVVSPRETPIAKDPSP